MVVAVVLTVVVEVAGAVAVAVVVIVLAVCGCGGGGGGDRSAVTSAELSRADVHKGSYIKTWCHTKHTCIVYVFFFFFTEFLGFYKGSPKGPIFNTCSSGLRI